MTTLARRRSISTPFAAGSIPQGTPISSTSILDFLNPATMPGDRWYSVPAATYTAGSLSTAAYAATGGAANGWIILVAATPGGAIVDMSPPGTALGGGLTAQGDLTISGTSTRIMFVGFKFINGIFNNNAPHIREWYNEHQFSLAAWHAEPNIGASTPTGKYHWAPRSIHFTDSSYYESYGCTVHNVGTGIFCEDGHTSDHTSLNGLEIYDVGLGILNPDFASFHPDGIACFGAHTNLLVSDFYIHGNGNFSAGVGWENKTGSIAPTMAFTRGWVTACGNEGMLFNVRDYGKLTASFTNINVWGNGTSNMGDTPPGPVNPAWQFVQEIDRSPYSDTANDLFTYSITSFPYGQLAFSQSGCVSTAGGGTDPHIANPSAVDPSTTWRTAGGHAITDWPTFFIANWP